MCDAIAFIFIIKKPPSNLKAGAVLLSFRERFFILSSLRPQEGANASLALRPSVLL